MKSFCIIFLMLALTACTSVTATPIIETEIPPTSMSNNSFDITSAAFANGETIPDMYSCKGISISPPLAWTNIPEGTQSFTLIMDDPDAPGGTWVHWVLFNIPASVHELPENIPADTQLQDGSIQGVTSSGRGYRGPCPPSGTHHYHFKLYALDTMLSLDARANKEQILSAMENHILGSAELIGLFGS